MGFRHPSLKTTFGWLIINIDPLFDMVLFSTLKLNDCALVMCGSEWVTVAFYSVF